MTTNSLRSFRLPGLCATIALLFVACAHPGLPKRDAPPEPTPNEALGGTIDVIIANGKGLVAVTDSRLSSQGQSVSDHGEKMILMDNHTICVIAGWYLNYGPKTDGSTFPAYAAVPGIIRRFGDQESSASKASPVEVRIAALAKDVAYTLNAVQEIALREGNKTRPEASEISLAAAVGDHIEVARMDLVPVPRGEGFGFDPILRRKFVVRDAVEYEVAGVEDVGLSLLDGTDTTVNDPILVGFRRAIKKDGGRSLSLKEMTDMASKAESLTSRHAGNIVGGPIEIGTIENGVAKILLDNPKVTAEDRRASAKFGIMVGISVSGGLGMHFDLGDGIMLFIDSQMNRANHQLDGMLLYNNYFQNCILTYDGSPNTIFDTSNKVPGSWLVVTKKEYLETPLVIKMRRDFPDLGIGIKHQVAPDVK